MPFPIPRSSLLVALAGLATAATPPPAHAQCSVYRLDVPDFDQRRDPAPGIDSLPGNGNCYCVPTSVMNWLAYIANNGYPNMLNGPQNWQSNSNYEEVTDYLDLMGDLMSTSDGVDPNGCGTNATGFTNGASDWLDLNAPGEFVVYSIGPNGTDTLTPQELYAQVAFGGLVAMSYSRWNYQPANYPIIGMAQRYVRQPVGHCVTLTRVTDACGDNPRVWYRDPAGFDGPDTDQAQFVTQISDLDPTPYYYTGDPLTQGTFRTMWRFADIQGSVSMLDSAWVITPVHGLWADPILGEVSLGGMWNPDTLTIPTPSTHALPGVSRVADLCLAPTPGRAAAVGVSTANTSNIYTITFGGSLGAQAQPIFPLTDPGHMAFDRTGRLHIADGQVLRRLDTSTSPATVLQTRSLIAEPVDIATRDHDRSVVLLYATIPGGAPAHCESHNDHHYPDDYMDEPFPPWCPVDPDSSLAIAPGDSGVLYVATPSTNSIYRLSPVPGGGFGGYAITHSSIVAPHNLHCTHDGRLVFTSDVGGQRIVRAMRLNPELGQWVPDTAAALGGQAIPRGGSFALSVARSYDDDLIDINTLTNIEDIDDGAPGIPDCFADFNNDGDVGVPDIFAFLAAWFAQDLTADVDLDDSVGVPDIFFFLAAWFAGC